MALVKKIVDPISKLRLICECMHCGERYGGAGGKCAQTCKDCRSVDMRKKICMENKALDDNYTCKYCKI